MALIITPVEAANIISISFGEPATLFGGITITPTTGVVQITREHVGDDITGAVHAIGNGANLALSILEVIDSCCRRADTDDTKQE